MRMPAAVAELGGLREASARCAEVCSVWSTGGAPTALPGGEAQQGLRATLFALHLVPPPAPPSIWLKARKVLRLRRRSVDAKDGREAGTRRNVFIPSTSTRNEISQLKMGIDRKPDPFTGPVQCGVNGDHVAGLAADGLKQPVTAVQRESSGKCAVTAPSSPPRRRAHRRHMKALVWG